MNPSTNSSAAPCRRCTWIPRSGSSISACCTTQGYVDDFGVRIKKKDGTPVDVSVSSSFCYDDHGNPVGMEGIIRDITERKKIEGEIGKLADIFIEYAHGHGDERQRQARHHEPRLCRDARLDDRGADRPAGDGRDCTGLPGRPSTRTSARPLKRAITSSSSITSARTGPDSPLSTTLPSSATRRATCCTGSQTSRT